MSAAARRHQEAAETLLGGARKDIAGYLYGLAAECGVKAIMLQLGMRPVSDGQKHNDPFFAHFTRLKTMLRDESYARHSYDLRKFTEDRLFMEHWDISMRYSDGKEIREDWVDNWRKNAKDVMAEI